jgi:hypothetical protein
LLKPYVTLGIETAEIVVLYAVLRIELQNSVNHKAFVRSIEQYDGTYG